MFLFLIDIFHLLLTFFILTFGLFGFVESGKRQSGPFKDTKADVILPDNTWIEGVEIKKDDEVIIHPFFGFDDHASSELLLIDFLSIIVIFVIFELVGDDEIPPEAFVHDEVLVPLSPLVLETPFPQIPANSRQVP